MLDAGTLVTAAVFGQLCRKRKEKTEEESLDIIGAEYTVCSSV